KLSGCARRASRTPPFCHADRGEDVPPAGTLSAGFAILSPPPASGTFFRPYRNTHQRAARRLTRVMKIMDEKEPALLKRAVRGDEQAFLALYQKHQAPLYRYALRMTGSPWAAEEVVQEVFLL